MSAVPADLEPRQAAALRLLHEAGRRPGGLTRARLEETARALQLPLAELYALTRFYHYFRHPAPSPNRPARCLGPACSLGKSDLEGGSAPSIACPGLCDQAPARFDGENFLGEGEGGFTQPRPVDGEEALFPFVRADCRPISRYRELGGYRMPPLLRDGKAQEDALDALEASGLAGRGGAAFPAAVKLRSVRRERKRPKYIVCNADEGEPGTFKDRPILHLAPHLLLDGMAAAAALAGAEKGVIYLRFEYPEARSVLQSALDEARQAGVLGPAALEGFDVRIERGAGSYVCGEETALLNSLEGKTPWPRERPPYPTESGLFGRPTAVHNVETLAWIPVILDKGPAWYRGLGKGEAAGTKIYSVSGRVVRPGNYELAMGTTARELILERAGGAPDGRPVTGFTLGGISGGLLGAELLDLPLDNHAPRKFGASLGSGGVVALDDTCCPLDFVRRCLLFYETESCGKCFPCRIGTVRLREILDALTGRAQPVPGAADPLDEIGEVMEAASACGLGRSAPLLVRGLLRHFPEVWAEHLAGLGCRAGVCPAGRLS